jgi:hypothetical protein
VLSLIHTLRSSVQHVLSLLSLLYVHRLSGNGFQHRRSLKFCVHGFTSSLAVAYLTAAPKLASNCQILNATPLHQLPGWRSSHTNLLLFSLPSQDSSLTAAGPRYLASARIAQKTPLPTAFLLLRACLVGGIAWQRPLFTEPLLRNGYCVAVYFAVVA